MYKSFDFLEKLSFERTAGSVDELKAANLIIEECHRIGVSASLERFEIDFPKIIKAKLEILEPFYEEFIVTGYGMTGSTDEAGIVREFIYVDNTLDCSLVNCTDKIVLLNGRLDYKSYKKIVDKKPAGLIIMTGSIYDDPKNTDLQQLILRPEFYAHGKIPSVAIRMKDAHNLLLKEPKLAKITLIQEENKSLSQNVVAKICGSSDKLETIYITAHYDSVVFSAGAYDNATGSISILDIMNYFVVNKPVHNMVFIFCGAEERGLLGSKAYCEKHKDEMNNAIFCVNVDMIGVLVGRDIACCTTEQSVITYLSFLSKEIGFPLEAYQGVYSSDSTPFADALVPAVSFARISPNGGAEIHTRRDTTEFLEPNNYCRTCNFIKKFIEKIDSSIIFPFVKSMPEKMIEELDYYNLRKERKNK